MEILFRSIPLALAAGTLLLCLWLLWGYCRQTWFPGRTLIALGGTGMLMVGLGVMFLSVTVQWVIWMCSLLVMLIGVFKTLRFQLR